MTTQKPPTTLKALADWLGRRRDARRQLESEERAGKERVLALALAANGTVPVTEVEGELYVLRIYPRSSSSADWEKIAQALALGVDEAKKRFLKSTVSTSVSTERIGS